MKNRASGREVGLFATGVGCTGVLLLLVVFLPSRVEADEKVQPRNNPLTTKHRVLDIVNHPAFKGFGELVLPWDDNSNYYDTRLDRVGTLMPYHSHVDANAVVVALNHLVGEVDAGKTIFYDFYTERQKQEDPTKKATGLFFYRGKPGAPFAIVCPGGGFKYVGSLHEGFPLALEISKRGHNAFVVRYRVDEQAATEDLAAAVSYVFRNAETLGVGLRRYSLWGASAGARMVGNVALRGVSNYGGGNLPRPATVVILYTGQSGSSKDFPPTFMAVSADDPIVNIATVESRVQDLRSDGVEIEYRRFKNAGHGFGLGVGTDAEGWIEHAIEFWGRHLSDRETMHTTGTAQPGH
jgi:acetyl esterase/lipase